ncbi:hypothetical protein N7495_001426 [Penicillium taxi]|uniref:uncharacterized protein n=1 Tax=Penicillium taxi TaxID=168475 RepID=UPI00254588D2|nr:uncharacterized protein N7495_001426 [Penicillium taxi]KAJ5908744.1 hypothetical protein N7495_001426 [Penicillium taxi]
MALLAKQQKISVIASCRHLSSSNTRLLQKVLTSTPYEQDKEKMEDDVRLPTLYSGQGGHKYTTHISSIPEIGDMASESGESTIATDTPPPYMEASASGDGISAASPPPYQSCTLQDSDQAAGAKSMPFSASSKFSSKLQQIERLLIVTIRKQDKQDKQDSQLADLKKRLDDLEELQAVIEDR